MALNEVSPICIEPEEELFTAAAALFSEAGAGTAAPAFADGALSSAGSSGASVASEAFSSAVSSGERPLKKTHDKSVRYYIILQNPIQSAL